MTQEQDSSGELETRLYKVIITFYHFETVRQKQYVEQMLVKSLSIDYHGFEFELQNGFPPTSILSYLYFQFLFEGHPVELQLKCGSQRQPVSSLPVERVF